MSIQRYSSSEDIISTTSIATSTYLRSGKDTSIQPPDPLTGIVHIRLAQISNHGGDINALRRAVRDAIVEYAKQQGYDEAWARSWALNNVANSMPLNDDGSQMSFEDAISKAKGDTLCLQLKPGLLQQLDQDYDENRGILGKSKDTVWPVVEPIINRLGALSTAVSGGQRYALQHGLVPGPTKEQQQAIASLLPSMKDEKGQARDYSPLAITKAVLQHVIEGKTPEGYEAIIPEIARSTGFTQAIYDKNMMLGGLTEFAVMMGGDPANYVGVSSLVKTGGMLKELKEAGRLNDVKAELVVAVSKRLDEIGPEVKLTKQELDEIISEEIKRSKAHAKVEASRYHAQVKRFEVEKKSDEMFGVSRYGSKNRIASKEQADEARGRIKEYWRSKAEGKLLNSGIDVSVLAEYGKVAVYHVEAGARSFAEFSKRMLEEFGEGIKPHLESLYRTAHKKLGLKTDIEEVANKHAIDLIKTARENEAAITSMLTKVAEQTDGKLVGLEDRLKTEESLTRKLTDRTEEQIPRLMKKGLSREEALLTATNKQVNKINDVVRYTMTFSEEDYVINYKAALKAIEHQGYKIDSVWNAWDTIGTSKDTGYRGINVTLISTQGQKFELQFHTPQSYKVKSENHNLYEEMRNNSTTEIRYEELRKLQVEKANDISLPNGIKLKGELK